MPSRVRCFLLTPTDEVAVCLRRYASNHSHGVSKCTYLRERYPGAEKVAHEVHDVEVEIARQVGTLERSLDGDSTVELLPLDDPRWPTTCACGFAFDASHARQVWEHRLHRRSDNGELVTLDDAPAGALYFSHFGDVEGYQRHAPGQSLVCKTPAGEWMIDGPASNGPGWTRTGTLPDISVTPSIGIGNPMRMHGWLRNGWLEIDSP